MPNSVSASVTVSATTGRYTDMRVSFMILRPSPSTTARSNPLRPGRPLVIDGGCYCLRSTHMTEPEHSLLHPERLGAATDRRSLAANSRSPEPRQRGGLAISSHPHRGIGP